MLGDLLKNSGAGLKNKLASLADDPLTLISEAGPMISKMYQPELVKFIEELQQKNLKEGEHHIGLHVCNFQSEAIPFGEIKIYVVAVDHLGNTTRKLGELPFELIFGMGILKKQVIEAEKRKPENGNENNLTVVKE